MTVLPRQDVRRRASNQCEYCMLSEDASEVAFHVEHIRAKQHGGSDDVSNLALACDRCNFFKGPNLSAIDPTTNKIVTLFHPRHDAWSEHFSMKEAEIIGLTPCGRATASLLQMNAPKRVQLRVALTILDKFPSP